MTVENTPGGEGGGSEPTVMDAINEALGLGGDDEQNTGADGAGAEGGAGVDEEGGDTGADEGAGEADSSDEQGGGEAGGDEPEGEGVKAADSAVKPAAPAYADLVKDASKLGIQQRNVDGTIKSGQQLAAEIAAKKGDGKGGQPQKGAKEPDALNDPIPKDVSQPTQQRMRTLIDIAKQSEARATEATENFNTMMTGLQAANVTPEQYGETLSFLSLFNSGDPQQQGKALEILDDMADKLATLLGRERKSNDPLERHNDLRVEVQAGKISVERAREIARHRNQGAFRTELTTAANTAQQQQQNATAELNKAREDLNSLGTRLMETDPQFLKKKAIIAPALKAAFKDLPPSKWLGTFQRAYNAVKLAPPVRRQVPTNQPLRGGKSPAGSGASAKGGTGLNDGGPKTMLEAMNQALADM